MTQVQVWDGSEDTTGAMSYGNMIQIKHGEELTTLYAHLSEINVQEGDTVVRGQRIGRIGDTGNAIGSHLHFEFITSDGRKVNPDWLLASDIMPLLSPDLPYATVKEWCNRPNGTRTISDFGVTREEVIAELSAHVSDSYYLGTPYQGRDWQSPNGDPSYNGRAGLNCGGFVAYVLSKCGLNSGTSDLWTHSAGPVGSVQWYMTQNADITGGAWWDWDGVSPVYNRILMCGAANYPLWVRNADLVAHTFATKADMLSSGVLEKGDIIVMIPKAAASSGFNDSHIGFFWGNSSSEDKMWHSDFSGNHISTITPKSPDNSFIVIKYGENTFDITLTKTSANVKITAGNPNYSLAGAVYNVYTKNATPGHDYSKDTVQATFTTDTNGKANLSKKLKDGDYKATVNSSADTVYGDSGNPNDVVLTWKRTNTTYYDTLEDDCHFYVYGLDLLKQFSDGKGDFANVQFKLYNNTDKYWVTADLNETEGIYYVKDQAAEEATATTFIPVSTGALTVKGLEDDEYIITEIATDDGYTLLKDSITVVITSAESGVICDVCGKSGITATATVNGDAVGMIEDNGSVSAIVPMSVINTRGFDLPQTGENGTWLFAVGGVLIVSLSAAFIFFILAKKRKTDEQ